MRSDLPLLSDGRARDILERICEEHNVSLDLISKLIDIQRDNLGRGRQTGISSEFSGAISEFIEEMTETADALG
jgi:hypothetical protein